MANYLVCTRNITKGEFGSEPGATKFLKLPSNSLSPKPDHEIGKRDWIDEVLGQAVTGQNESTGQDCGDILVFVHGYNNSQKTVMQRHKLLKSGLEKQGFRGVVVSFDWPSADQALNYLEDRSDAKYTAITLVDDCIKILSKIQNVDCEVNVHLLAHSMGAYVIREGFDDADDRKQISENNWTVSQTMFVGADISSESMSEGNPKCSSLYRHSVRVTNYSNPFDSVLKISNVKRAGVSRRAGRIGLPVESPEKSVNVGCGDYYESSIGDTGTKSHSWYFSDQVFMKDVYLTISGDIDRNVFPTRGIDDDGFVCLKV